MWEPQQSTGNRKAVENGVFYAIRAKGLHNEDTSRAAVSVKRDERTEMVKR
jgi:hypothetical protein